MAFQLTLSQGGVLIIPDSAVNINVASSPSGIATSGIVAIVGEANEGPSWSQDAANGNKLSENSYGPTDIARVQAKYGSGRLVDAFRGAITPSASNRIQGSPNRIILVKSNNSTKASRLTSDNHGTFEALRGGEAGNGIQQSVATSTAEDAASTDSFSYVPSTSASSMALRVNGGAAQVQAISANMTPAALAAALTALSNLNAVGGVDRSLIAGLTGQNIELSVVSGQNVEISLATPNVFASPAVGDTLRIPTGSVLAGTGSANVGWYLVTSVSNLTTGATISAKKITTGAPLAVAPTAISATPASDLLGYSSMTIDNMSGTNRNILTGLTGQNITISVVSSSLTATLASGQVFATSPRIGDIVYIPSGSAFAGSGSANVGWYQVVTVSNSTASAFIQMSRLSNGLPVAVAATPIAASSDIQDLDPQIKGIGKTLEIYDNGGAVNINTVAKQLGVDSAASWLESMITSSAELRKTLSLIRSSSNTLETFNAGGSIAFSLGYNGTAATASLVVVSNKLRLQTSVTGGSGGNLDLDLSKVATISDMVSKINANTGYSAAIGSTLDGQRNPSVLDQTSFSIASTLGNRPGRVKHDLWDITGANTSLNLGSGLADYIPTATAGLPEDNSALFLSGGDKGGSTGLQMSQAVDALQGVRCNFVVPAVSRDASLDIADDETESTSTYTVDAVNAAVKSHCINMSTPKTKRHRIGIVSKKGTFAEAKQSALTMSNFRIGHVFQDVIDLNSDGELETFQPWMGGCKAAGMQAAGVYKSIFNKTVNISGVKHEDFDDENVSQAEDALTSGLIPLQRQETGGINFLSDQMTYGIDNNFVYNSMQAVYVADLMALSLAQSLKTAFVGESVADVTTGAVQGFVEGKMAEFLALKFTVGTSKAPAGWKSISVNITPGVISVNVVAVEATSVYFIPINLDIEGIEASNAA